MRGKVLRSVVMVLVVVLGMVVFKADLERRSAATVTRFEDMYSCGTPNWVCREERVTSTDCYNDCGPGWQTCWFCCLEYCDAGGYCGAKCNIGCAGPESCSTGTVWSFGKTKVVVPGGRVVTLGGQGP